MFKMYNKPGDMFWELVSRRPRHNEFWALREISFELNRGSVMGIIGSNGAGKSTLLKIITGNLDLTSGKIEANGQIAAILELGSGFNPEYTGRENIYNGGIVAGMTRKEIDGKIEEIIEFSGIRKFIDQPIKTYSSGMHARLAFSLAVSRRAEILILDEALAAGDAIFANKCLLRIKEICESDTTVLFVSHSTDMVRRFCNRAIWLEHGRVVLQGDAESITKAYDRYVNEQSEKYLRSTTISANDIVHRNVNESESNQAFLTPEFFKYGSKEIRIVELETFGDNGEPKRIFSPGERFEIHITHEGKIEDPLETIFVGCQIFTPQGILAFTASSRFDCDAVFRIGERGKFKILLNPLLLGGGEYLLSPCLYAQNPDGEIRWLDFHDRLYRIQINSKKHPGVNYIVEHPVSWSYEELPRDPSIAINQVGN
jgi:lipopolysaccharide transport system ATP-binding protein